MITTATKRGRIRSLMPTALEIALARGKEPAPDMQVPPPNPPQANGAVNEIKTFILPSARDRWMASNLHYYKPKIVENTARSAMSGNLVAQWLMFDLMEQTWPRLSKNLNELKNAVLDLLDIRDLMPYAPKGAKPSPEAMRRRAIVSQVLWDMTPDVASNENGFDDMLFDAMDGLGKGISVQEIDWELKNISLDLKGTGAAATQLVWKPRATHWVHPRYYGWPSIGEGLDRLMLNTREIRVTNKDFQASGEWMDFPEDQFLLAVIKQKTGHPLNASILRILGYFWAAQNFTWEWFIAFAQIFGNPFRWATYDPSLKALLPTIEAMLQQMGAMGYAAFPDGTKLEFKEATTRSTDNPQKVIIDSADSICDILILGQTLTTTQGSRGSQSLGKIHKDVRDEKIHALAKRVVRLINEQLIPGICRKNFGDTSECPFIQIPVEQEDSAIERIQRDQFFNAMADVPKQWFYERHGVPVPEPGEDVIPKSSGQQQPDEKAIPNLDNSATAKAQAMRKAMGAAAVNGAVQGVMQRRAA